VTTQVLEVNLDGDPAQYTRRQAPAERIDPKDALARGAVAIGHIMVARSDRVEAIAARAAANLGADFIAFDDEVFRVHGSEAMNVTRAETNASGTTMYRQDSWGTTYTSREAYWVYLYRKEPGLEEGCSNPRFRELLSDCSLWMPIPGVLSALEIHVQRGCNGSQPTAGGIPQVYYLVDCLVRECRDASHCYVFNPSTYTDVSEDLESLGIALRAKFKKLEILLEAGLDPNTVPGDSSWAALPESEVPEVLRGIHGPAPTIHELLKSARTLSEQEVARFESEITRDREEIKRLVNMSTLDEIDEYLRGKDKKAKAEKLERARVLVFMREFFGSKVELFKKMDELLVQKGARVEAAE
jgi:hypothetical protein